MLHCPDCGEQTLRTIENTEPDGTGEYKQVCTCDGCENIVYIVRNKPCTEPEPQGQNSSPPSKKEACRKANSKSR